MPIIHIHSPEVGAPEGPLYVPRDQQFNLASLVTGLALRDAVLSTHQGGYMGDITPPGWDETNAQGNFILSVQEQGEIATVSFVPFNDSRDIILFASSEFDGPITTTREFNVHNRNSMALSRPVEVAPEPDSPTVPVLEIGGLVLHATDDALVTMREIFINQDLATSD